MNKKTIIVIAILSLFSKVGLAWGKEGHQIVAQIAQQFIGGPGRDTINYYLNGISFEEAATWMDEIKSDHSYDYMKPWHYINIEKDATYVKSDKKNIVTVLEFVISQLKHRSKLSKEEIEINLKMLFHLVGDLHQPLHVGYGSDRGGNDVHVKYLGKTKANLHYVWDEKIIQTQHITFDSCMALANKLSAAEIKAYQKIDVVSWMYSSRDLLPNVYAFTGSNLSKNYIKKNASLIKRQLVIAGIRLAAVLNTAFKY